MLRSVLFLVINLEESADRLERLSRQFSDLDLSFKRVPAVRGAEVIDGLTEVEKERFISSHGREIRPGELGCYLSHLKAMETFLQSGAEVAVILEDDADLPADRALLEEVLTVDRRPHWDFLRLQSRRDYWRASVGKTASGHDYCLNFSRSTGATAYAVNRKAAGVLLEKLRLLEVPFDHAFDQPHLFGLSYLHVYPNVVGVSGQTSTIETSRTKKTKGLRKLSALGWRARTETGRFLWSSMSYVQSLIR